jgi:hypothetical protein
MLPLRLCPAGNRENIDGSTPLEDQSFELNLTERELWVNNDAGISNTTESQPSQDIRRNFLRMIEEKCKLLPEPPDPVVFQPLQFCTMCIIWEFLHEPESLALLAYGGTFDFLLRILSATVVYQGILESVSTLLKQCGSC